MRKFFRKYTKWHFLNSPPASALSHTSHPCPAFLPCCQSARSDYLKSIGEHLRSGSRTISLQFSLSSRSHRNTSPRGILFISATVFTQNTQRTSRSLGQTTEKAEWRGAFARSLCSGWCPGREVRHQTVLPPFCHSRFSPRARLKGRIQNTGWRGGKASFATDAATSEKQKDAVLDCLVRSERKRGGRCGFFFSLWYQLEIPSFDKHSKQLGLGVT